MVLEPLTRVLSLLMGMALAAPVSTRAAELPETGYVVGYKLSLFVRDGLCIARFEGQQHQGELTLAPTPPCLFVRKHGKSNDIESYFYKDKFDKGEDHIHVVVVTGTILPRNPDDPITPLTKRDDCGSQTQALLLRKEGVLVSKRVAGGACAGLGLDGKEFWMFAHWSE
ncbi:MAG: hypothetical protein HY273_09940 [Gammaproteobacteria bacterium]|nr:hypothetical protein [Gammaproteobacteria bacterium]